MGDILVPSDEAEGARTSSSSEPTSRTAHAGVSKDLRQRALRSLTVVIGNQNQQTATENTTETQPHSGKLYNRVQLMNKAKPSVHIGKHETNRVWVLSYKVR